VRQNFKDEGIVARVRVIAGCRADRKPCQDVGLPVRLHLHARDPVVEWQCLQSKYPRVVVRVLEHEWRDRGDDLRYLAAREAVMPSALKPLIRIVGLRRPRAGKDVLRRFARDSPEDRGSYALPKCAAEARFAALAAPPTVTAIEPYSTTFWRLRFQMPPSS
jgi:hypothetical protein